MSGYSIGYFIGMAINSGNVYFFSFRSDPAHLTKVAKGIDFAADNLLTRRFDDQRKIINLSPNQGG